MIKGFYQYLSDLRAIIQKPLYLLFLLFFLIIEGWRFSTHLDSGPVKAIYMTNAITQPFTLCFAMYLSIRLYARDLQNKTIDWLQAYPVSYVSLIIGKWFAVFTYMSLYTVIMIGVFLWGAHQWDFNGSSFWSEVVSLIIHFELSSAITLSIGFLLASFSRLISAYFIGFFVWLFGIFIIPFFIGRLSWPPLEAFHLRNSSLLGSDPVWGTDLLHTELKQSMWVFGSLFLLFFVVAIVRTARRRPVKYFAAPVLTILFTIGCVVGSLFPFVDHWLEKYTDLSQHKAVATGTSSLDRHSNFSVKDYQIDVFHSGGDWTVYSKMTILTKALPSLSTVSFTIDPDFIVQQITINGRIVSFKQENSIVSVSSGNFTQSAASQTIAFVYTGDLEEWGLQSVNGHEGWFAFTGNKNFYVPSYLAWYPIPGEHALYLKDSKDMYVANYDSALTTKPVSYTVRLHRFKHPVLSTTPTEQTSENSTQVIKTTNRKGVTLFSGTFITWKSKNVSVVLPTYFAKEHHTITSRVSSIRDFLQTTFERPIRGKIILLPMGDIMIKNSRILGDAYIYPCSRLKNLAQDKQLDNQLIDYFLTGGKLLLSVSNQPKGINQNVVSSIDELYRYENDLGAISGFDETPVGKQIMWAINSHHTDQLKEMLRKLVDQNQTTIKMEDWNTAWKTTFGSVSM